MVTVLLADDDADIRQETAYALRKEGFRIIEAADGSQALSRWKTDRPDVLLLDADIRHLNGLEVCRRIRNAAPTPVIMLSTARDDESVVQGFLQGADDYVVKPFSLKQLAMRIRAVSRRSAEAPTLDAPEIVRVGNLTLHEETHQVEKGGRTVHLTPLEFRILYLLAKNVGRIVPSTRLVEYVWGYDDGDASLPKTHISRIRKKLNLPADGPTSLQCISGLGYIMSSHE